MTQQRYEVKGKIGQGGLGEVYLAHDTQLDREVALKRMKIPEDGNKEAVAEDLLREAKTLSALQHPNIVTVYDVGRDDQGPFVVLELLKGETLDQVIERGAMTQDDFYQVVVQTLEGLIAAQAVGLVHRDLKPGNLMVIWLASGKFQLKILDFGLAKFGLKARPQTEDQGGGIFGSIFFMAPEQFERLPLDSRTDMYSLGCIYYQILTTRHPFGGQTAVEVMASHLQHHVAPLGQLRPDLPEWLCHWVMWLISREMDDRPPDARTALDYFLAHRHGLKDVPAAAVAPAAGAVAGMMPHGPGRPGAPVASGAGVRVAGPVPGHAAAPHGHAQSHISPGRPPLHAATGIVPPTSASTAARGGTMATSRSSTVAIQRLPKKKAPFPRMTVWITTGILAAAATVWFFFFRTRPEAPTETLKRLAQEAAPAGNSQTVGLLGKFIRDNAPEARQAVEVLKKLDGEGIGEAILAEMEKTSDDAALIALMDCLSQRPAKDGVSRLTKMLTGSRGNVKEAILRTLPTQASSADVPALNRLIKQQPADAGRLLDAVLAVAAKEKDPKAWAELLLGTLRDAPVGIRQRLFEMLGRAGNDEARSILRNDIAVGSPEARNAALDAAPAWPPDKEIAQAVLATADKGDRQKAIRIYCAIVRRIGLPAQDRLDMVKQAQALATGGAKQEWVRCLETIALPAAAELAASLKEDAAAQHISKLSPHALGKGETHLNADRAVVFGEGDASFNSVSRSITGWRDPATLIGWDVEAKSAGTCTVTIKQASNLVKPRTFRVLLGQHSRVLEVKLTGGNEDFQDVEAGEFTLPKPGVYRLWLEPVNMEKGQMLMNVREVVIKM